MITFASTRKNLDKENTWKIVGEYLNPSMDFSNKSEIVYLPFHVSRQNKTGGSRLASVYIFAMDIWLQHRECW